MNTIWFPIYTHPFDYVVACYLHPIDGRPSEYLNEISSIVQKCPIGTVFRAEYCVCGQDTSFSKQGLYFNISFKIKISFWFKYNYEYIIQSPAIFIIIISFKKTMCNKDIKLYLQ